MLFHCLFIVYVLIIIISLIWYSNTQQEKLQLCKTLHEKRQKKLPDSPIVHDSKITSMIEFFFKQSDNEVVGSGRSQLVVSHVSPLVIALNEHLISLDATRCLLLHRNGPFAIASRDEILVDEQDQIFARVLPLGNRASVDELRLWVEQRKDIHDEKDLPKTAAAASSGPETTDCIIFLYSTKLLLSDLNKFVRKIYEQDLKRKNDQLGNKLFYFKEIGSAMAAAEQHSIRSLANQQLKSQILSSSSGGSSSAEGVTQALKLKSAGEVMLQQHMGQLGGQAYGGSSVGGGGMGNVHRPFIFMMTPFRTNKRIENMAGSVFRHIEKRVKDFTQNKAWWIQRGQPHTYGLLVKGPPGCGKTSLIKALANSLELNIFDMAIHAGVTQRQLFDFYHDDTIFVQQRFTGMILDGNNRGQDTTFRIPMSKRLLVFDDFTAGTNIFEDRESLSSYRNGSSANPFSSSITNGNDPVTLQFILNLNDGVLENEDRITIYADNYDNIDRAMLRPGRIDDVIELGYITYEGMIDFFVMFFEIQDVQVLHSLFQSYAENGTPFETKVLTAAELNRIFMTHREDKLEKIVHSVVGESIRFKQHYDETGDSYYKRMREQQDMNELFPPDSNEEEENTITKKEEDEVAKTENDEIKEKETEEKPDDDNDVPVLAIAYMETLPSGEKVVMDPRQYRRKLAEDRKKRMEEAAKEMEDEERKRKADFLQKMKEEDDLKNKEMEQLVQSMNQEAKGVASLFARKSE